MADLASGGLLFLFQVAQLLPQLVRHFSFLDEVLFCALELFFERIELLLEFVVEFRDFALGQLVLRFDAPARLVPLGSSARRC